MLSRKGLTRIVFVLLYCFPNNVKSCSVFVQVSYLSKDCKRKTGSECFFFWLLPQHLARGLTRWSQVKTS